MRFRLSALLVLVAFSILAAPGAHCQFKEKAFSQNYNDPNAKKDTTKNEKFFSFAEYYRGITHKDKMQMSTMCIGSSVFVGGAQIYNKQYWKLPVIYGGLAASVAGGLYFRSRYEKDPTNTSARAWSNGLFVAGGLIYWGAMFDGVYNYKTDNPHYPARATMYSILLPGLGQIYNGEAWKLPIYWGGLIGCAHFYILNNKNYERYRNIYNLATTEDTASQLAAEWPHGAQTALYYRNAYRRLRDYSLLGFVAVYLLQAIDANVFAYMQDFEVSDNIAMRIEPTIINSDNNYALGGASAMPAFGMRLGLRF